MIQTLQGWRRLILWPIACLIKLWGRSLRFKIDPEKLKYLRALDQPCIIFIWHNRLFFVAEAYRRYLGQQKIAGLVSASKDGAWLSAFFDLFGIEAIRGSSSKRGSVALGQLQAKWQNGYSIAITPDGPRGPCYSIKPGIIWLAEHTQAPLLLLRIEPQSAWRLQTWDRFYIPKPFSEVMLDGGIFHHIDELLAQYPNKNAQEAIEAFYQLNKLI